MLNHIKFNYSPEVAAEIEKKRQSRIDDCVIGVRMGLFDLVQTSKGEIYNRTGTPIEERYIIEKDTRIPNYTTSIDAALELAILIGLKEVPVPNTHGTQGTRQMVDYIIKCVNQYLKDNNL